MCDHLVYRSCGSIFAQSAEGDMGSSHGQVKPLPV